MYTAKIGHGHLKVRNLERAVAFYTQFLGLAVTEQVGAHYAFLSSGPLHHDLALQEVGPDAPEAPARGVGLYHLAFEVPDKAAFREAYDRLISAGVPVSTVDHLISWAMYFKDPDGNGLEIYCDTRHEPTGRLLWHGENRPIAWPEPYPAGH